MASPNFKLATLLFGGSFDPIHLGHLHIANSAMAKLPEIKQVVFVPCNSSPGKEAPIASGTDRLEFLRLSLENTLHLTWDAELKRPPPSFTVDTLQEAHRLGATRERLYCLLGADAYEAFPKWKSPEIIRKLARLVVVGRSGSPPVAQNSEDIILEIPQHPASSSAIRKAFSEGIFPNGALPPALFLSLQSRNPYAIHKI